MHSHYTNKLLNIEDVIIKKIGHADTYVEIYLETKPHEQTDCVNKSRIKKIPEIPGFLILCSLQTLKSTPLM